MPECISIPVSFKSKDFVWWAFLSSFIVPVTVFTLWLWTIKGIKSTRKKAQVNVQWGFIITGHILEIILVVKIICHY